MHVNNYFINSLVLAFSCGKNGNNTSYDTFEDLPDSPTCVSEGARMVIGKNIQWTDTVGGDCEGGSSMYNIDSIKDIVRLTFNTPPATCESAPLDMPITTPQRYLSKVWTFDNITAWGTGLHDREHILSFSKKDTGIAAYLNENVIGEVIIILTEGPVLFWEGTAFESTFYEMREGKQNNWAITMRDRLLKRDEPIYVIIVDWSMYLDAPFDLVSQAIVDKIISLIHVNKINPAVIDVIGFSTSAHIGGLLGNVLSETENKKLNRLTALDPDLSAEHYISENSALLVQTIHTNTRKHGMPGPVGKYNIYVNGGEVQPHCSSGEEDEDLCSHRAAISYYIESISVRVLARAGTFVQEGLVTIDDHDPATIAFGYYLEYDKAIKTDIFFLTTQTNEPYLVEAHPVQIDETVSHLSPNRIKVHDLLVNIHYQIEGAIKNITFIYNKRLVNLAELVGELLLGHELATYYLIIGDETEETWDKNLTEKLLVQEKLDNVVVIHVDWTKYQFYSYNKKSMYAPAVGNRISDLFLDLFPISKLHIIGFSVGAHIAGVASKILNSLGYTTVERISGLDPAGTLFEHPETDKSLILTPTDAPFVDVYHTDIFDKGVKYPTGSVDFYINGGYNQPGCSPGDSCAHLMAYTVFMASFTAHAKALKIDYEGNGNLTFITETIFSDFGFPATLHTPGAYYIESKGQEPYLKSNADMYFSPDSGVTEQPFDLLPFA